eukprot:563663-Rhodomonas_salina.1
MSRQRRSHLLSFHLKEIFEVCGLVSISGRNGSGNTSCAGMRCDRANADSRYSCKAGLGAAAYGSHAEA